MFGLFYPENNVRYLPNKEFELVEEADDYMEENYRSFSPMATNHDVRAWINAMGVIFVLRKLEK